MFFGRLAGLVLGCTLAASEVRAWTAADVLPEPNYSDDFSPMPSLPKGEKFRIQEIKFPVHGRPALLRPGDELRVVVDLDRDPASANLTLVGLRLRSHRPTLQTVLDLGSVAVVTEDPSAKLFLISAILPSSGIPYDLYDLELEASSGGTGYSDAQPRAVKVLEQFREDYTFVQLSDVHQGDPRGTSDNQYRQDIIDGVLRTLNFLQPEFVVISGDLAYGEKYYEEFPDSVRTFDQARFPTFAVPGNHDAQRNVFFGAINDGIDYYRGFWGPPYYSFDYGNLHFAGVDSIDRPREDREIGINGDGIKAEFWGGVDLDAPGGTDPQLDWLEQDLEQAALAGQQSLLYQHHDPSKDFTPGFESHDVWNFEDPEYASSSDSLRGFLARFGIRHILVGHDHYDEVREVLGTTFIMTTTASSERRFGSYWGYRLFRVKDGQITTFNYVQSPASVPYGYPEDPNLPDVLTPYLDLGYLGANDGASASVSASIRNSLAEPMSGRLEFFVSGTANQSSRGTLVQEAAVSGAVRVLVDVTAPAGQTILVRLQPSSTPPPAPTGLTARVTPSSIRVRWNPVTDTDLRGYKLRWQGFGQAPGSVDLLLQDLEDPEHPAHEIQGLSSGATYIVQLSAFDAAVEGASASTPSLTLHTPPAHPANLRAVAGDRFVDLSFSPSAGAVAYLVYYGSGPGDSLLGTGAAEGTSPVQVTATRVRLSGLKNGDPYRMAVSALDGESGESPLSGVVRVVPESFASADLDGDGKADAADRAALLRTQASLAAVDGALTAAADLNGNLRVDLGDAVLADALLRGKNTAPIVRASIDPPALAAGVPATLDASRSIDREDLPSALQFRFDFEGSGQFTPWSLGSSVLHTYPDLTPRQVLVEARDSGGLVGRTVLHYLPRAATHLYMIDVDGCRRDVLYRWIAGTGGGHRALRDDILGSISFGGTHQDAADFSGSSSLGADLCRALFPTVTFTNQAAIPMGQHARIHGIAGNEFFDRDLLFERSFVGGDAQSVYTEGKALATLLPGARAIYEDASLHGLASAVVFHQYPKGASSYVSQTTPEFGAFILDPAQEYDQLSFYRALEELLDKGFPPLNYIYLAGLDHRAHAEGIESMDDQMALIDTFFETLVHGGSFSYPDITVPSGSHDPIDFAGFENLPDPLTPDPNDTLLDNSIFCFTADHGQINYGDGVTDVSNITIAVHQYFDPDAVVEGGPPEDPESDGHTPAVVSARPRSRGHRGPRTGLKDAETLRKATVVAEMNGPSMFLYVKNRARGTWAGYPDFHADVLPLARAMAKANTDGQADNVKDGAIRDIVVRRTGSLNGRDYSEGYVAYLWDGQKDELIELDEYFSADLQRKTNILQNLRGLESRRSGDVVMTVGRSPAAADTDRTGWNFGLPLIDISEGQHGDWTPGESLIPQVCGGRPVARLGLQRTEPLTSQVDFAPTAAQFLGISMEAADGRGYLYPFAPPPPRFPQLSAALGSGSMPAGNFADLTLRLSGATGASALRARLRFDSRRLTLAGLFAADATMLDTAVRFGAGTGDVAVLFEPLAAAESTVLKLRFLSPASAPAGAVAVTLEDVEIADAAGIVQAAPASSGSVQITLPAVSLDSGTAWGLAAALLASAWLAAQVLRRRPDTGRGSLTTASLPPRRERGGR